MDYNFNKILIAAKMSYIINDNYKLFRVKKKNNNKNTSRTTSNVNPLK